MTTTSRAVRPNRISMVDMVGHEQWQMLAETFSDIARAALAETKPAQSKLTTLILDYARDLRRNSRGGATATTSPWEYAKATADYLEDLVRRSETKPAQEEENI